MKRELLRVIEAARAKEAEILVPLVDDSAPASAGVWTAKDNLAHLSVWREYGCAELDAGVGGPDPPELAGTDDEQNAKFYAETHDLPAKDVVERASRSWAELARRVADCSEDQLQGPRPGHPEQQLWEAASGNGYGHLAEHLGYWYADAGDEDRAEATAVWAYQMATTVPSDNVHGIAEYNFACFFAKRARLEEALPHLKKGLELRPDLHAWASEDPDLDPIRDDPEVAALLEG